MFNEFEESIPDRFTWDIVDGKCRAIWLPNRLGNVGLRFEIGYLVHGDRPTTVIKKYEITEVMKEDLSSFIQNYWSGAGFTSEDEAVNYYKENSCDEFATKGFIYIFRRVE